MGGTPWSMKQFAQSNADDALKRLATHPIGIEAPSIARCGSVNLEHACCLIVADIVRRAIGVLGPMPDFRVFVHDDGVELKRALRESRQHYIAAAKGEGSTNPDNLSSMVGSHIWRTHGRRFLSKTSPHDWVPVFEQSLCGRWIETIDSIFKGIGVEVTTWNTDAEISNQVRLLSVFEERLLSRDMLWPDSTGALEVRTRYGSYPWRTQSGEPSTFARDVVYQALKLSTPRIEWKNFWCGASNAYVLAVIEVLQVHSSSVTRLTWPLERASVDTVPLAPALGIAESFELGGLLESEGRSVTRLALLRAASGQALTSSLSWAHEKVAALRQSLPRPSSADRSEAQEYCRTFLSSPSPLMWCLEGLSDTRRSASFLTNAVFIEDVIGVVIER